MVKLLQTFEKLGFAQDPYLGYLSVSPRHLGTAFKLSASLKFKHLDLNEQPLNRDLEDDIKFAKSIAVRTVNAQQLELESDQTLAPNYNDTVQATDFFEALLKLDQVDAQAEFSQPKQKAVAPPEPV